MFEIGIKLKYTTSLVRSERYVYCVLTWLLPMSVTRRLCMLCVGEQYLRDIAGQLAVNQGTRTCNTSLKLNRLMLVALKYAAINSI